ncbi:MAG: tetratricopeptide repeat protein [bacterium]|nr:tetratricopeptide repeat protein [bacterium]MDD5354376.1 tetratricopeptide repeat protein [bacterium]MDD5756427.1 tetratricopeptide repeat protein [bacterium]
MNKNTWLCLIFLLLAMPVHISVAADRELKALLVQAQEAEQKKDFTAAIEYYQKALDQDYQPGKINLALGRLYLAVGNDTEAEKHLLKALGQKLHKGDQLSAHELLGTVNYHQQNFVQAMGHFKDCLELKRNYEPAYLGLAKIYKDVKMYPEALQELEKISKSKKLKSEYNLTIGLLYRDWGLYQKALKALLQVIGKEPTNIEAHLALADIYYRKKEYSQALGELQYIASLQPQGKIFRYIALCLFYLQEEEKAIATLLEAIKIEPNEYLNYAIGGLVYSTAADWQNAKNQFTRSLDMNPQSALVLIGRGWCERQLQQNQNAIADFQKVLELKNESWMRDVAQSNITILTSTVP